MKETEQDGGMLKVTVWAITVTIFSCIQITIAKWLSIRRGVAGDIVGVFYMIVEGIIGTICLVVTSMQGSGIYALSSDSIALLMVAAVFAYTGIVVGNFSISIGISGVVVAIYNANAFIHVLLSAIFLKQEISKV